MSTKALAVVMPSQILKLVISLGLQIMIARLLLPEGRGVYAICIASSTVLLVATYLGNEFGIRYMLMTKQITSAQAFYYLIATAAFSFLLVILITYLAYSINSNLLGGMTRWQLLLACVLSFSQLIATQINVFMTLKGMYVSASLVAISEEIIKLVCLLIFLPASATVETALTATFLGSFAIIFFCVIRYKLYVRDFDKLKICDFVFIFKYGLRSVWLNISNLSNAHMGTLLLSGLVSTAQVGIYNLAFGLVARMQILPDALNRVLVPVSMASSGKVGYSKIIQTSFTGLLVMSIFVVPVFFVFNKDIVVYLFGYEYIDAGLIGLILLIGFVFKVIGKPLEAYFNEIIGRPNVIAGVQMLGIMLMGGLTYFGAVNFGLAGAAVGSALAMFLGFISLLVSYLRSENCRLMSLINFDHFIRFFGFKKGY